MSVCRAADQRAGLPDIDLDDLRAHPDYHGYKATDAEIAQFWSVLRSFSKEETALSLQFVTGTSKVGGWVYPVSRCRPRVMSCTW